MAKRTQDTRANIYSFTDETLLVCPRCAGCALSRQLDPAAPSGFFAPRRLVCAQCGHLAEWHQSSIRRGWENARDDFFELPLWLQIPCCGEVLWAYNARHLEFLETYVQASLRERVRSPDRGWSNQSLASRLPAWIKSAKNREEVLQGIARLRERLGSLSKAATP